MSGITDAEMQLRDATRKAHEVLGDLRRTIKEARGLLREIDEAVERGYKERVETQVQEGLAAYQESITDAMNKGVEHVLGEFDKLEKVMLGTDKKSQRQGKDSIPQLVQRKADAGGFS